MTALLAFLKTPLGAFLLRWGAILAISAAAAFAFAVHERNVQYQKDEARYAQERKEQAEVNARAVAALNAKYRKLESDSQARIDKLGADYDRKLKAAKARRDADLAAVRAGTLKLSFLTTSPNPDHGSVSNPSESPAGSHGASRVELPPEITASLFELANDADQAADQLRQCQAILVAERIEPP